MLGLAMRSEILQILTMQRLSFKNFLKEKCVEKVLVTKEHQLCSELPGSRREKKHFRKKKYGAKVYVKYAVRVSLRYSPLWRPTAEDPAKWAPHGWRKSPENHALTQQMVLLPGAQC